MKTKIFIAKRKHGNALANLSIAMYHVFIQDKMEIPPPINILSNSYKKRIHKPIFMSMTMMMSIESIKENKVGDHFSISNFSFPNSYIFQNIMLDSSPNSWLTSSKILV
jgi:hypothetical protein